ncbi:hypothetical protein DY000_02010230 [Brassica cretica]|uniref:At2g35280-like TPR domain-containing protein n=1 Tax=Brassica cretica TaxID=69181 RepID=A0ABQ7CG22_BRACR|nr:hypothetical protein DY000_02010230 [Brassica cretica]
MRPIGKLKLLTDFLKGCERFMITIYNRYTPYKYGDWETINSIWKSFACYNDTIPVPRSPFSAPSIGDPTRCKELFRRSLLTLIYLKIYVADDVGVYASFDLFNYPWYLGRRHLLLRRCYAEGNLSTLYIKGVVYFYGLDRLDEGLRLLKRAADAGYERALYTYAMTRKFFCEDEESFSCFTRESIGRMGMVVRNEDPIWVNRENNRFITKRHLFMSTVVPLFYSCQCSPCLDRDWVLWYIEHSKTGDMCNRCF